MIFTSLRKTYENTRDDARKEIGQIAGIVGSGDLEIGRSVSGHATYTEQTSGFAETAGREIHPSSSL
jgi:hypothetical protein